MDNLSENPSGHAIRRIILEQSRRANVGHIGSALSVADLLAVLYDTTLRVDSPADPDRDRFILSKGHAGLALYAALHLRGWVSAPELDLYCADGGLLGVHPIVGLRGIDFTTGSLGLGLSFGTGAALAARLLGSSRHVYVLISDAECNEGSVWEAAMFAAHHRLSNLTAIIDCNGQQALGYTKDVLDLERMCDRWESFGWAAEEIDGHDTGAIAETLDRCRSAQRPTVVIARTIFGKGVSFMQNQIDWHYWPMDEAQYRQAMREIGVAATQ